MSLVQSIGIILGANIGTTVTAQMIAFPITEFALPAIGLGAGLKLFLKTRKWVYAGEIILGFGILFYGLSTMKGAIGPIKGSSEFIEFFHMVGDNPLLGIVIGALVTILVQSSSATIGITLVLASSGVLSFSGSVALIMGENIGTTLTTNLAAVGANLAARRTALAHFLFNAFGTCLMLLLMPLFMNVVSIITQAGGVGPAEFVNAAGEQPNIARYIANTHTFFNVFNVLLFLPFVGLLAKTATLLLPGHDENKEDHLQYLDRRVLSTPPIALAQARSETRRMAQTAQEMLEETIAFLKDQDLKRISLLEKNEELMDVLQKEISDFLVVLSQKSIAHETSREVASMLHMVNDLERVGDHCENLWVLCQRKLEQKISFSDIAMNELTEISDLCKSFLERIILAIEERDTDVYEQAQELEDAIDAIEERLRNNHIKRLNTGECTVDSGLIFIDMLHNFEKIGDHTFNIARAVVGKK
jgi:phosphate:Na+ symporter